MENKKVLNATECFYNGIRFRSKIERASYILLDKSGLNPRYEERTFCLWEGRKISVPHYDFHSDRKMKKTVWGLNKYKLLSWEYTPDFICYTKDKAGKERMAIIEVKGNPNDVWTYKKKLFLTLLEKSYPNSLFFEVHNQKQLKSAIQVIKCLKYKTTVT